MLKFVPEAWGPQVHAPSGSVTRTRTGPNAISFTSEAYYAILLVTPQPERIMTLNSDKRNVFEAPAATLELVPQGAELFAEWRRPKENYLFALWPERLRALAIAEYDHDRIDFAPPASGQTDREAASLAQLLESEFRRIPDESINEIYVDSLLTVFGTHLLKRYGSRPVRPSRARGGLRTTIMSRVDDYIRANLAGRIYLADLAALAGVSPTHFARAFRQRTGQPPYQYITKERLRLVAELAKDHSLTIGEIAAKAGFATHSQMTATMRRYWGITPSDIRRGRVI
ncbi:AraC family transcriptional regulator [Mesorhizobium sp. J18]|uniref:helix-turn-helix transcriptional regulator n=1 Tax=Mesorhizobium sp. J18 TaxID=935263 RepID=UPI00119BD9FA|nr:AraC family transcriptional regulator [Mesorhizobium sp. J18]TWG95056.1 AraC family transcriptional regulator [Mesorhizobium sp. J18]